MDFHESCFQVFEGDIDTAVHATFGDLRMHITANTAKDAWNILTTTVKCSRSVWEAQITDGSRCFCCRASLHRWRSLGAVYSPSFSWAFTTV